MPGVTGRLNRADCVRAGNLRPREEVLPTPLFASLIVSQLVTSEEDGVSISPGFTSAEIAELVCEYRRLPYGQKGNWLAGHGLSYKVLRRWELAIFDGDLDRGLIPRHGGGVSTSPGERNAIARVRAAEAARHEAELALLQARVRELEQTNEALGKAIGLLHAMSEHEPADAPTTNGPEDSSPPTTDSSPS